MDKKVVYCSGPLFSPDELDAMLQIAAVLEESGYRTFLPPRDGLESLVMNSVDSHFANSIFVRPLKALISRAVFSYDMYQIVERCDSFVFNMNGPVPDEGGVVETAAAFASGKPIVLYRNDLRGPLLGRGNPLLMGASYTFSAVGDIREIPDVLKRLEEKTKARDRDSGTTVNLPAPVQRTMRIGRMAGKLVNTVRVPRPKNRLLKNEGRE